jgi:curved DNA-binding protein CbpA
MSEMKSLKWFQAHNYYEIFQLSTGFSEEQLVKAFRKLALRYHPDRTEFKEAAAIMALLVEARETLSNPNKRRNYDLRRRGGGGEEERGEGRKTESTSQKTADLERELNELRRAAKNSREETSSRWSRTEAAMEAQMKAEQQRLEKMQEEAKAERRRQKEKARLEREKAEREAREAREAEERRRKEEAEAWSRMMAQQERERREAARREAARHEKLELEKVVAEEVKKRMDWLVICLEAKLEEQRVLVEKTLRQEMEAKLEALVKQAADHLSQNVPSNIPGKKRTKWIPLEKAFPR